MASKKPLVCLCPPHLAVLVERSEGDGAGGGVSDDLVTQSGLAMERGRSDRGSRVVDYPPPRF
jgi:hypothetical protein